MLVSTLLSAKLIFSEMLSIETLALLYSRPGSLKSSIEGIAVSTVASSGIADSTEATKPRSTIASPAVK